MASQTNRGPKRSSASSSRTEARNAPEQQEAKRRRVARACDQCRSRKSRCDGKRPQCWTCSLAELDCTYGSETKRRGLAPGYVRSLELLLGLVFSTVPNGEEVICQVMKQARLSTDSEGRLLASSQQIKDPSIAKQAWASSCVYKDLRLQLAALEECERDGDASSTTGADPDQEETSATEDGSSNLIPAFDLLPDAPLDATQEQPDMTAVHFPLPEREGDSSDNRMEHQQRESPKSSSPLQSVGNHGTIALDRATAGADPTSMLPPNAHTLLDLYFSSTHCWLPMIDRAKMFEVLYSSNQGGKAQSGEVAAFWAILAYSQQQMNYESSVSWSRSGSDGTAGPGQDTYMFARRLVQSEEESTDLGHAQALLILGLYQIQNRKFVTAWHLIGRAARVSLVLQKANQVQDPPIAGQREENLDRNELSGGEAILGGPVGVKKALLSCFILDTLTSISIAMPPHLRAKDMEQIAALKETGPDEWEPRKIDPGDSNHMPHPVRALSTFNCFYSLIRIINGFIWPLEPSISGISGTWVLSELRQWLNQLPPHCTLPDDLKSLANTSSSLSPALLNLHIAHALVLARIEHVVGNDHYAMYHDNKQYTMTLRTLVSRLPGWHSYSRQFVSLSCYQKLLQRQSGWPMMHTASHLPHSHNPSSQAPPVDPSCCSRFAWDSLGLPGGDLNYSYPSLWQQTDVYDGTSANLSQATPMDLGVSLTPTYNDMDWLAASPDFMHNLGFTTGSLDPTERRDNEPGGN